MTPIETLIPIFGMVTGVLIVAGLSFAMTRIFTGPVGQAIGRRINAKSGNPDPDLLNEIASLRSELDQVQQRLMDAEERIDFSERLLAQKSQASSEGTAR